MNPTDRSRRRHRAPRAAGLALVALTLALLAGACGRTTPVSPLIAPSSAAGRVVAGVVSVPGTGAAAGVAVVLEPVVDGLPLAAWTQLGAHAGPARPTASALAQAGEARAAVTDASGRYAFAAVEPGAYLLRASIRSHRAATVDVRVAPARAEAETTYVDLALVPVGEFHGTAKLADGASDEHHSIVVAVEGSSQVAVTAPSGAFVLDDVPVGTHTVRASRWGYRAATASGTITAAGDSVALASLVLQRDSNIPPVATASAAADGNTLVPFALGGGGSDDDGTIVRYEWDFEDDGTFDWSSTTSAATTHLYPTPGTKRAKLRVVDDQGAASHDAVTFHVHDAYHVSLTGLDTHSGTATAPFRTLAVALAAAAANGHIPLRVGAGTYTETLDFPDGVDVTGGYDAAWARSSGSRSVIDAGSGSSRMLALTSADYRGLEFRAANATTPGASSIAAVVQNCGSGVTFADCAFVAGNGAAGAIGVSGATGTNGGGYGGGFGGMGAYWSPSQPAQPGEPGEGPGGGTAGAAGGGDGGDGAAGVSGSHGGAALPGGSLSTVAWFPNNGAAGQTGGDGSGGGGGGGGIAYLYENGSYGSSGGAGGQGGGGGTGGKGGGASFALFWSNTLPQSASFATCAFTSGAAGNGGNGGNGGLAGAGHAGSTQGGFCGATCGGDGGDGGAGAPGGGGSGGPGGYTYAVISKGTVPSFTGCTFAYGVAGSGGSGGYRLLPTFRAPNGPAGAAGQVWLIP